MRIKLEIKTRIDQNYLRNYIKFVGKREKKLLVNTLPNIIKERDIGGTLKKTYRVLSFCHGM